MLDSCRLIGGSRQALGLADVHRSCLSWCRSLVQMGGATHCDIAAIWGASKGHWKDRRAVWLPKGGCMIGSWLLLTLPFEPLGQLIKGSLQGGLQSQGEGRLWLQQPVTTGLWGYPWAHAKRGLGFGVQSRCQPLVRGKGILHHWSRPAWRPRHSKRARLLKCSLARQTH